MNQEKYYVDQYDVKALIEKMAQHYKELVSYIDISIADQGKIFPSSVTMTPRGTDDKTVSLTITAIFDEPITDTNNPYKSGAKGMRYMVNGTVYNIPYNDIKISGSTMTAKVNYTADNYGIKNIVVIADTDKLNNVQAQLVIALLPTPSSQIKLTFTADANTSVPIYYTKDSFIAQKPDDTILLTANQKKTTIINRPEIYRFGVVDYDPSTGKRLSVNLNIKNISVEGTILDGHRLFDNITTMTECDVSKMDTSKMVSMFCMFQNCTSLSTLNVSNFDTSNVTDMSWMFYHCMGLTSIDVSNFDTSKVTAMTGMFNYCDKLTTLDLSNFDTANVTNMNVMFQGCINLPSLNVSNFNTSKVTDMSYMFYNCRSLTSLNLAKWNISSVTNMSYMFAACSYLTTIGQVDKALLWKHKPDNYTNMFTNCPATPKPAWYN